MLFQRSHQHDRQPFLVLQKKKKLNFTPPTGAVQEMCRIFHEMLRRPAGFKPAKLLICNPVGHEYFYHFLYIFSNGSRAREVDFTSR